MMELHFEPTPENPYAWDYLDNETGIPDRPYDELGILSPVLRASYHLAFFTGGALSLSMLYLVLYRTSGHLKNYGRMLMLCSITDLSYWLMDNMLQLKARLQDGVFMAKFEGPAMYFSYNNQAVAMACYVATLAWIHSILPAQYYFRYYAVTRSQPLSGLQTASIYILSLLLALPLGFIAYPGYSRSATSRPGFNYGTLWYREVPLPKVLYADIRDIYQQLYFFYANLFVTASYLLSLYFAYKTVLFLKQNSSMYSERTKSMQNQLARALFFQTLLPIFVSIGPILFICVPSFFYMNTGKSALIFMNMTSWIPVFNPLLTIIAIVPYRRAVLECFGRGKVHTSSAGKESSNKGDGTLEMMM
ncbi:unnamed protein product [Bursaphelenchus xylophilus]|uniref:(pine wood nematode) hypothetical protein n=1 Tax=Bursaphelenchus xylophilus TaxID=6326 RepID=A0A1I7RPB8_BURXY|nr:unnamed protein product [Bursaphelenchus xylophilus]CAG9095752.1 unnamed protein product [Bursaphelenchus xylophilus]